MKIHRKIITISPQDNHKNSMAGQTIVIDCVRGDEVVVYAYTGTWLADFPMNHYTHWVGLLLKPNMDEVRLILYVFCSIIFICRLIF